MLPLNKKETREQKAVLTTAYKDFNKNLNSHAYFKVNSHSIGQDLVQNTFLKTWNFLLKGNKIVMMKAFLYHILNNLIIDEYRRRKVSSLDVLLEKGFEPAAESAEDAINIFDGKKAITQIKSLPKKYQEVMLMRYVKGLSLKEISDITGQSKNTLSVQLHRGLIKLKKLYIS